MSKSNAQTNSNQHIKTRRIQFGKMLAAIRQSKGLTRYAVAKASGLEGIQVKNIETGHTNYTFDSFIKVCTVLQVDFDAIFKVCQAAVVPGSKKSSNPKKTGPLTPATIQCFMKKTLPKRAPKNWYKFHHANCGTLYRGCDPQNCPKDQYEKNRAMAARSA